MLSRSLLVIIVCAILFGLLMALRSSADDWLLRSLLAAIAGAVFGWLLTFIAKQRKSSQTR